MHWVPDVCIGGTLDSLMTKPVSATTKGNRFTVFDLRFDCRYNIQVSFGNGSLFRRTSFRTKNDLVYDSACKYRFSPLATGSRRFVLRQARSHNLRQRQRPGMQRHFSRRANNAAVRTRRRDSLYASTSTAGIPGPRLQGLSQGSQGLAELGLSQKLASLLALRVEDRLGQKAENFQWSLLSGRPFFHIGQEHRCQQSKLGSGFSFSLGTNLPSLAVAAFSCCCRLLLLLPPSLAVATFSCC